MGQYIMGLLGAAAIMGVMEHLLPSGAKSSACLRLVACLCLVCLSVEPLSAALEGLPTLVSGRVEQLAQGSEETAQDEYQKIFEGQLEEAVRQQLEDLIGQRLAEKFGVGSYEVGIDLAEDNGAWELRRVIITLMGRDILKNPHTIESYFYEWLGCQCVVVIG